MSHFLSRLVARSQGTMPRLEPLIAPRFAPGLDMAEPDEPSLDSLPPAPVAAPVRSAGARRVPADAAPAAESSERTAAPPVVHEQSPSSEHAGMEHASTEHFFSQHAVPKHAAPQTALRLARAEVPAPARSASSQATQAAEASRASEPPKAANATRATGATRATAGRQEVQSPEHPRAESTDETSSLPWSPPALHARAALSPAVDAADTPRTMRHPSALSQRSHAAGSPPPRADAQPPGAVLGIDDIGERWVDPADATPLSAKRMTSELGALATPQVASALPGSVSAAPMLRRAPREMPMDARQPAQAFSTVPSDSARVPTPTASQSFAQEARVPVPHRPSTHAAAPQPHRSSDPPREESTFASMRESERQDAQADEPSPQARYPHAPTLASPRHSPPSTTTEVTSQPLASRRAPQAEANPTPAAEGIHVHIGQVFVRAQTVAPERPKTQPRHQPKLSLADYLKQHRGGDA
ncbi:MAG: hypothetical protein JNJ46_22590 [Myxococcales bacterium]|nr:hypothetical protein [Myxococcales bacterium]